MSTMPIQNILQYLDVDESLLKDGDNESYNSYIIPDDTVIQITEHDKSDYHTVTYVQVMNPTDNKGNPISGPLDIICQVEGFREDPVREVMGTKINVRIYKQVA